MQTLVIVTHPDIKHSVINKRWVEELKKFPEKYVIHQLYEAYPDEKIDRAAPCRAIQSGRIPISGILA